MDLKSILLCSVFEWLLASTGHVFSSSEEFLDFYTFT